MGLRRKIVCNPAHMYKPPWNNNLSWMPSYLLSVDHDPISDQLTDEATYRMRKLTTTERTHCADCANNSGVLRGWVSGESLGVQSLFKGIRLSRATSPSNQLATSQRRMGF